MVGDEELVSGSDDGTLRMWNIKSGALLSTTSPMGKASVVIPFAFCLSKGILAVGIEGERLLHLYQFAGSQMSLLKQLELESEPLDAIFRADETLLIVGKAPMLICILEPPAFHAKNDILSKIKQEISRSVSRSELDKISRELLWEIVTSKAHEDEDRRKKPKTKEGD